MSFWRVAAALLVLSVCAFAQEFKTLQAERVATSLVYIDGVVWSRGGFLIFSDVVKKRIFRLDPGVAPKPTEEDANGAQGLAYDVQSRLYICESATRRVVRTDRKGSPEVLVADFQGKKFNSPNDIAVRKDFNVYFTDPAFAGAADSRELDFNGIFHVSPKGGIEAVARWKTRPNGIAISNDGKTLYVTDSDRHAVVAFDLDGKTGAASNPRDVVKNIDGVPGGMRVDVNGRMYVGANGLGVYAPDGKLVHTFLPGEIVTNCAFGDADFETLYVTGKKTVYKIRVGVKGATPY